MDAQYHEKLSETIEGDGLLDGANNAQDIYNPLQQNCRCMQSERCYKHKDSPNCFTKFDWNNERLSETVENGLLDGTENAQENYVSLEENCQCIHSERCKKDKDYMSQKKLDLNSDGNQLVTESEKESEVDRGWSWVVMVACFGGQTICTGLLYTTGLIHIALTKKFRADDATTTWASAIFIAMTSFAGPLSSSIADRYGCRTAVCISGLAFSSGYVLTAVAPNIETCIFSVGILAGTGAGMAYTILFSVNAYNFRKKLNVAQGFSVSGCGFGILVMPPVIQFAHDIYGYYGLMMIIAGIVLQLVVFGTLMRPSKLELETIKKRKRDIIHTAKTKQRRCEFVSVFQKVLTKKATTCLSASMFLYCGGLYTVTLQLPKYAQRNGFSAMQSALFLSIIGVVTMISRMLTGFLAHQPRINEIWIYSGSIGVLSLVTFIVPVIAHAYAGHIAYSVCIGVFGGCCYVVINTINRTFVGVQYTAAACAVEFWFGGIGSVIVPVMSGYILSFSGEYSHVFYLGASCVLLASVTSGIPAFLSQPNQDQTFVIQSPEKEPLENGELSRVVFFKPS